MHIDRSEKRKMLNMLKKLNQVKEYKEMIEVVLSGMIIAYLISNGSLLNKIDFFNVIYSLLSFIIIIELIRMIGEYIFSHHIKLRLAIDTFILFTLREVILIFSDKDMEIYTKITYVAMALTIAYFLFIFREKAIQLSSKEQQLDL